LNGGERIRTGRKEEGLIVFSVALAVFMVRLDGYIVNISLPAVSRYFDVGLADVSWIVLSYLLVMTSSMLVFGKLSDRLGLRKIFVGGYAFFSLGSLLCGLSPTIVCLNLSRGLQGIGGAMMVASAFAIISHHLPQDRTGWAFGICAFANSLGIMVGAPLGGLMTGFLSWHWIFLINVPVGCLAMLVAWRALPGEQKIGSRRNQAPFDIPGAVLSVVGLAALVYTLTTGGEAGWQSPLVLLAAILSLSALAAFVYRETQAPDPLLDLSLFRNRTFSFAILTTVLAMILLAGGNFLLPFYLEIVQGLRPEQVGAVILVYSVVYMPIGLLSGRLSDHLSPARICSVALFLTIFASLIFAFLLHRNGLAPSVLFLVILAVAYGFFFAPNNHLVMSLAPSRHEGVASGVYSTVMNVGMILGICFFGGIFSLCLPTGLSVQHLDGGSVLPLLDTLIFAFRNAFLAGAAVCCTAFVLSLFTAPGKVSAHRS